MLIVQPRPSLAAVKSVNSKWHPYHFIAGFRPFMSQIGVSLLSKRDQMLIHLPTLVVPHHKNNYSHQSYEYLKNKISQEQQNKVSAYNKWFHLNYAPFLVQEHPSVNKLDSNKCFGVLGKLNVESVHSIRFEKISLNTKVFKLCLINEQKLGYALKLSGWWTWVLLTTKHHFDIDLPTHWQLEVASLIDQCRHLLFSEKVENSHKCTKGLASCC